MVGMGSSSSSGDSSEIGASAFEIVTTLGGAILGMGVLFLGVTGVIMSLPDPTQTHKLGGPKMKTADEAAKDAKKRLEKWHDEQAKKYEYHLKGPTLTPEQMSYAQNMLKEHRKPIIIQSSLAASKAAHDRLARSAGADKAKPRKGKGWGSKSSPPPSAKWKMGAEYVQYRDSKCEDERSFLLDLLTDRQLNEFMEYIERDEEDDGEYYRAETLKKNSCCCGATIMSPCACMFEGVMDCSAVEPKCPCYEWPSNVNSPIELDNYESKCPRCKTDLTEEWWDEVHDEELGYWEVEEGGRAKFYRTWYGNCPSCRSYLELPDYNYDIGEDMAGWEPSYIDRAESFSADDREKWGHSLSEVIYDDGGNRICGCEDDDPVDECCIIDPRHPIYNEDNLRKAINNLSEIGRSVLNEIFEINPDEDFDGDDLDMWLEDNWWWMDDFSREYWQFAPKRQTKIGKRFGDVWDWLDEYGNLSDQKWSKLLGPDDPRVNPPPTCAGCDSEDIEFYHDYYGGFCGGDCFDGYLEGNNLENYSRTEKDLDAESVVKEYNPEKLIPIGTKVRSYDFWPHNKECYKEGVIVDHAPSPSCSPHCLHYHIKTTKVVMGGKLYSEEKGEIFMTHPYADIFDQEYAGQLAPHIQIISTAFPSTSTQ